ncbi:hypothetical protein ACSBR1_031874 [Camellia fascicularis]
MSVSSLICKSLHHLRSATRASSPTHHHNLYFLQNHPFSSSSSSSSLSSSLKTTPNQHSFAVNYFINSCGFPLEKAISASNYVKFKTPNKPDSVLAFLENHGFTKTQISNLVRKHPPVILCKPEKTFLPKFHFFKSKGVSSTDVVKILSSEPSILKRSLENTIIPSFNLLKKLTDSPVEIIKRCARVLFFDLQVSVVPNIEILREAGVPNAKIVSFFKYEPRRFMTTSDRFRKIVNEVKKMGFNPVGTKSKALSSAALSKRVAKENSTVTKHAKADAKNRTRLLLTIPPPDRAKNVKQLLSSDSRVLKLKLISRLTTSPYME